MPISGNMASSNPQSETIATKTDTSVKSFADVVRKQPPYHLGSSNNVIPPPSFRGDMTFVKIPDDVYLQQIQYTIVDPKKQATVYKPKKDGNTRSDSVQQVLSNSEASTMAETIIAIQQVPCLKVSTMLDKQIENSVECAPSFILNDPARDSGAGLSTTPSGNESDKDDQLGVHDDFLAEIEAVSREIDVDSFPILSKSQQKLLRRKHVKAPRLNQDLHCGEGHQNSFFAKIQAILTAIKLAHSNGWVDLWIESDSSSALSCIQNASYSPPWKLRSLWFSCRRMMDSMRIHYSHIFREGNAVADKLANMGLAFTSLQWWSNPPKEIKGLLHQDYIGRLKYRFH
ncbi:Ribonuclease H [Melia azedarach]|uniref:Ribonuclease H n=1 Tax=Melia azedarach TaxID=155640 RepID=A0ACC1Y574_MELAZ|nr:Ribonuclease H [Melia azedarach]